MTLCKNCYAHKFILWWFSLSVLDSSKQSSESTTEADAQDNSEQGREHQLVNPEEIPHGTQSEPSQSDLRSDEAASSNTTQSTDHDNISVQADVNFPQLPLPPKTLPRSEWTKPDRPNPDFLRLSTSHATLPTGFNPFPEGKAPADPYQLAKAGSQLRPKEIGPQLPPESKLNLTGNGNKPSASRDVYSEGPTPKTLHSQGKQPDSDTRRLARKRQSSDINQTGHLQASDLNSGHPVKKKRALDRCSIPRTHQPSRIVQNVSQSGAPSASRGPGFLPRQVKAQQRRKEGAVGQQDLGMCECTLVFLGGKVYLTR